MSGIEGKFNVLIPRDNSDILKEDLEKQSNAIHDAIGNSIDDMHMEFSGPDKSDVNGIVYGMEVSFDAGVISVSKGVVYNRGRRGAFTSIQTADIGDVAVDDYLVARIVETETDPRTNPVTHVNEDTFIEFTCELVVTDTPTDDDTILAKIFDIDAGVPVFGDSASWVYSFGGNSLSIYPVDGSSVDVRGNAGNKYFVRFKVLPNVPVSVEKIQDVSGLGFVYLNIILEGDETGVVVTTLEELSDKINLTPQWFRSEWSGTGTAVPTLLASLFPNYSQFTGGNDYRKYYEVTTGSFALSQIPKFNTSDPFTKHIGFKGSGIPSVNNPHGLTLGDIGAAELSTEAHIKREHYDRASIPRSVSSEFLQVSLPTNFTLQVQKSLSDSDVALIAGRVLKVNSVLSVTSPSLTFDLNEIYVNLAGIINRRVVATYNAATALPGYLPIQGGSACLLSIIDKQKHLTGDKELYLTVSGGGTVLEAKFGTAGEVVDVSLVGEYLLQDLTDNSWIRIYRESEVIAPGSYGNTVTFTSFSDDNELPVCLAWWKGSSWGYAGGSSLTIDLRSYGTMSMNNERYLDLANTIPLEFRPVAGFTNYEAASLDLVINPFEIKYRGLFFYKTAPTTQTFPNNSVSFLCANFSGRNTVSLSVVNSSSYVHVSNRVALAKVTTNATSITEVNELFCPGSYNTSDKSYVLNVSSADDFYKALISIKALPSVYSPVINIRESFVFDASMVQGASLSVGNVKIVGINGVVSFSDDGVTGKYVEFDSGVVFENFIADYSATVIVCSDGVVLEKCRVTTSGILPFINASGDVVLKDSSIPVMALSGVYSFKNIDSVVTGSLLAAESGKLVFKGVDYISGSTMALITVTAEPTGVFDISLNDGKFSGNNKGVISLNDPSWDVPINLDMSNSSFDYTSVVAEDFGSNNIKVSAFDCLFNNYGFIAGLGSTFKGYGNCTYSGEFVFKSGDVAASYDDSIKVSILGGTIDGLLEFTDFTLLEIDSSVSVLSDPLYKTPVRSFINVVGNYPDSDFLDVSWGTHPVPVLYYGSTYRDLSLDISVNIADLQKFFFDLNYNDFQITVVGDYDDNTTILEIVSIMGSGKISLEGEITLGGLLVQNVTNSVEMPVDSVLNIETFGLVGLRVINSPDVYFRVVNLSFQSDPSVYSRLLSLVNSSLKVSNVDIDGTFTSVSTPDILVHIDKSSYCRFTQNYTIKTNIVAGANLGTAMIYIEDGGVYDFSATPTFTDWYSNFVAQIDSVYYPKCDFTVAFNHISDISKARTFLNRIRRVDGNLVGSSLDVNPVKDLNLINIDGSGTITLNDVVFKKDNFIQSVKCNVIIHDCDLEDQTTDGKYALSVINSPNVKFTTLLNLIAGANPYECLLVDNSKVWVEQLKYLNVPSVPLTNYIDIINNSEVYFKKIVSKYESLSIPIYKSVFISVLSGSKVHVKAWEGYDASSAGLDFKSITDGSYVTGWTGSGYEIALNESGITIVEI